MISRGQHLTAVQKSLPLKHCAVAHYSAKCIRSVYVCVCVCVFVCLFCLFFTAKYNIRNITKLFIKTVCSKHALNLFLTKQNCVICENNQQDIHFISPICFNYTILYMFRTKTSSSSAGYFCTRSK